MKNEGPYVLEWIAHHLAIGFDNIMIFSADCDDQTDRMLDRLEEMRLIKHCPNPKRIFKQLGVWHVAALRYATMFNMYTDSDWVLAIDVDEFLEITPGNHHLNDLFEQSPAFDLMSFTVVGYNSSNIKHIGDGSVQGQFFQGQMDINDLNNPAGKKSAAVKTLGRNGIPGAMFRNHRPKIDNFSQTDQVWLNGAGNAMPPEFTDRKVNLHPAENSIGLAHVNHHSLRSMESFMVKVDRGDAVNEAKMGLDDARIANVVTYWNKRNAGLDVAKRIPEKPADYDAVYKKLKSDPALSAMHETALNVHSQKIERILTTEGGRKLAEIIGYFD
ncbi:glycosyltransferase family 2 protein [Roseovarius sp. EL26]|uniref:glycosyltransferase family 2 protein n=1 Tax=Roseovarius sp. EL26 TaxID=2126672 RepID=UPI0020B12385|nr:glycosyltransferase family 2 protein [Roseovarius sp. EL26]